jgi:transcriptional regulator with XRE-family HTH domain
MAKRVKRHVLTTIRNEIGVSQSEFAAMLGCTRSTVASLEMASGRLELSQGLAQKISDQTGVAVGWLLANNLEAPPVRPDGTRWKPEDFDLAQARKRSGALDKVRPAYVLTMFRLAVQRLAGVFLSAFRSGKFQLLDYKTSKLLEELESEFGSETSVDAKGKDGSTVSPQPPGTTDRLLKVALEGDQK